MKKQILILFILLALTFALSAQMMMKMEKMEKMDNGMQCPMMNNDDGKGMMDDGHGMMMKNKMDPEEMMENPMQMMQLMEPLNLTDDQSNQIMMLVWNNKKMMNTKMAEIDNFKIDKMAAMKMQDFDKEKQINASIMNDQLAIMNAKVDVHKNIWQILTPEQREMVKTMIMKGGMEKQKWMNKDMNMDKDKNMDMNKDKDKDMKKGMKK